MEKQAIYFVENGMAILSLKNSTDQLKCQLPVSVLKTANNMLANANMPKFQNWFQQNQNFGLLFRIIFFAQIAIICREAIFRKEQFSPEFDIFYAKWCKIISNENTDSAIKYTDYNAFYEKLAFINKSKNLYLLDFKEINNNPAKLISLFELSYQI